jgi:hypothetical protein
MAYTSSPFAGAQIDFSALAGIGQNIGQGYQRRALADEMQEAFNPDGTPNYQKMAQIISRRDAGAGVDVAQTNRKLDIAQQEEDRRLAEAAARYGGGNAAKPLSAPTLKLKYAAEDDMSSYDTSLANLGEARKLVEGGIYEGGLAPIQSELGANWNYGGVFDKTGALDTDKARRTQQYTNIMGPAAMERMALELKGSTAYQELLTYQKMFADPRLPKETKIKQLDRLVAAIQRHKDTKKKRVDELSGASDGGSDGQWEEGQTYDTPMGPKRYLGNDEWEDAE